MSAYIGRAFIAAGRAKSPHTYNHAPIGFLRSAGLRSRSLWPELISRTNTTLGSRARVPSTKALKVRTKNGFNKAKSFNLSLGADIKASPYNPLITKLANKTSPSVIYEGPTKALHIFSCYSLGGFCIAWAGIQVWDLFLFPTQEISQWIQMAMGGVCIFMVIFAGWTISKTFNIVRTIKVVPFTSPVGQRSFVLEIKTGNFRTKSLTTELDNTTISGQLHKRAQKLLTPSEKALEEIASRERWADEKKRLLTLPFRQMWKGFKTFRELIFNENWLFLQIKGRPLSLRLHKDPAWAMEEGRVIDTLLKQRS